MMNDSNNQPNCLIGQKNRQSGAALLIFVIVILLAGTSFLFSVLNSNSVKIERDKRTAEALTEAKAALIGFAASVDLTSSGPRPGDLPCPDNHPPSDVNEGTPSICSGNALGRLPWKKLGLPDLRDGSGERLWYAISTNFKNSPRIGTLNSDTQGTITFRDNHGNIINNGCAALALPACPIPGTTDAPFGTGLIAVIIAPGSVLIRQDGASQVRDIANANNPINYLDIGNGEDNASFINGKLDGFIKGDILDAGGKIILNDKILTISTNDLMPLLEKRVASEALHCLTEYAAVTQNQNRYPWAAPLNSAASPTYSDVSGSRFGRLPVPPFTKTQHDSGDSGAVPVNQMNDTWSSDCKTNVGSWWNNWREMVFYALADAYKPANLDTTPTTPPECNKTGTCLKINPPEVTANKKVAIFLARRSLNSVSSGQPRTTPSVKGNIANYLENENSTPADDVFTKAISSDIFNDLVLYN
jgi:hypothetical protein